MADSVALEAREITKRYGNIKANERVNLRLRDGEVHALLGENGAGKSTLSKILYGFTRPDSGQVIRGGITVNLRSPRDARALGIGMVFQNFMLIPALSVVENIALFLTDLPAVVRKTAVEERIRRLAERFGLRVDPGRRSASFPLEISRKSRFLSCFSRRRGSSSSTSRPRSWRPTRWRSCSRFSRR